MNVPHGGCEGVGWAACLERSHWDPHARESHKAPKRADLLLGVGVQQQGQGPQQTGAGVLQREAGAAPWNVSPTPDTPSLPPGREKHRSKHNPSTSAYRARLSERGLSRSTKEEHGQARGKIQSAGEGTGFGAALQGLCLVWCQRSLFNSSDWRRLGRKELFVKG